MSVMYLMDMKKYEEAETYTASVLSRLNCRPQEKFLILAVFMILICILLYCVLSDMLKKSNTEMELAFLQKQKQLKQEQDYSLQVRRQDTQDFQTKTVQELLDFQILLEQIDLINGQRDDLAVHVGADQNHRADQVVLAAHLQHLRRIVAEQQ